MGIATLCGTVRYVCGRRDPVAKIVVNSLVQLDEVHMRALLNASSCSSLGITVGIGDACGLRARKKRTLLRESMSDEEF